MHPKLCTAVPADQVESLEADMRVVRHEWTEDIAAVRRDAARAVAQAREHAALGSDAADAAAAQRQAVLEASLQDQRAAFQVYVCLRVWVPCPCTSWHRGSGE